MATQVKKNFIQDSDIINIKTLRSFITSDVNKKTFESFKGGQKFQNGDRNAMVAYFKGWMNYMAAAGVAELYVNKALTDVTEVVRAEIIEELKSLMKDDVNGNIIDNFSLKKDNIQQCADAGIWLGQSPPCDPKRPDFPKVNQYLWEKNTWCNNCWLCTLRIEPNAKSHAKKECEHILPYLTGSYLLATSNTSELNAYEFAHSHSLCNQFKKQGEFIKYEDRGTVRSSYMFVPDYEQIANYLSELTGNEVSFSYLGSVSVSDSTILENSSTAIKFKNSIFNTIETYGSNKKDVVETMAKSIVEVCKKTCEIVNAKGQNLLIAIFLHAAILDWLFHEKIIKTYEEVPNAIQNLPSLDDTPREIAHAIHVYNTKDKKSAQQKLSEKINNALAEMRMNPAESIPVDVLKKMLYKNPIYHFGKRENLSTKVKRRNRTNFGTRPRSSRSPDKQREDVYERYEDVYDQYDDRPASPPRRASFPTRITGDDVRENFVPYIYKIIYEMSVSVLGARTTRAGRQGIINLLADVTYGSVLELLDTMNPSEVSADADVHPRLVGSMFRLLKTNKIRNVFPSDYSGEQNLIYIAYIYSMVVYTAYGIAYNPPQTLFGKKKPKVNKLPNKSIMTKLKSVGIKITKKQGKRRVYLSRSELIKKATAFKNLQLRAKKLKVRIMYKNKKGKYVYKTAKRLTNDIKRVFLSRFLSRRVA